MERSSAGNRCPNCKRTFRTLADEMGMHECPYCGYGPDQLDDSQLVDCRTCGSTFAPEGAEEWKSLECPTCRRRAHDIPVAPSVESS